MSTTPFIHDDYLLETRQARSLYHEYARDLPIVDYHNHLPPADVASDRRYSDIAEVWLGGDHYKWRAMRSNGVSERFCTGDASGREKFDKWAETVPYLVRNPLYDWTHLELARYFGISDRLLDPDSAEEIWDVCNEKLGQSEYSARGLMMQSKVVAACTTDDPTDTLEHHAAVLADDSFDVLVLPAWRPDKGMAIDDVNAFNDWVDKLEAASDVNIRNWTTYIEAFRKRHSFFHENGCRLSDHGLDTVYGDEYTSREIEKAFAALRSGKSLEADASDKFKSAMLYEFGVMDAERGWTQQYHLGAMRNNNSRMFKELGPDTGFDSIGDLPVAAPLSRLLDRLASTGRLTRTILYNLNPRDNALLVAMLGNFQDGETPGKMQFGSGWWFLDNKDGMELQLKDLSRMGLLSRFVGMLTDSRSFLSFTRHEYFRRILCNLLGNDMQSGVVPDDIELIGRMVSDICYHNAVDYFGFEGISGMADG